MGVITGIAIADIGNKPDPEYCQKTHTALDIAGVILVIWTIFFIGAMCGYIKRGDES